VSTGAQPLSDHHQLIKDLLALSETSGDLAGEFPLSDLERIAFQAGYIAACHAVLEMLTKDDEAQS